MPAGPVIAVLVPCRMNAGMAWGDACVHEVAPRALVISTAAPLQVGSYVDIRRGTLVIIGRVAWVRGGRVGIRTQDPISAAALVNEPRLAQRPAPSLATDRRGAARQRPPASPAALAERGRRISSALQFAALTAAVSVAAYLIAAEVHMALTAPFARAAAALGG